MSEMEKQIDENDVTTVRSDIEAGWQLERRKKIIADMNELLDFHNECIRKIKEDAEYKLFCVDSALKYYFDQLPHKKTKTQESYALPGGKLVLKVQNPEYKRDDKTVIDWLKQNNGGNYIKVKEELDWSALKADTNTIDGRIVNSDGEFIPGVEVINREPKFMVEVKE